MTTTESIELVSFDAMLGEYESVAIVVNPLIDDLRAARSAIAEHAGAAGFVSDSTQDMAEFVYTLGQNAAWAQVIYDELSKNAVGGYGSQTDSYVRSQMVRNGVYSFDSDEDRDQDPAWRVSGGDYVFRNRVESIEYELELLRAQPWSLEAVKLMLQLEDDLAYWADGSEHPEWGDPGASADLGIRLVHARILNVEAEMEAYGGYWSATSGDWVPGLNPDNTLYYDAQYALGRVYLDEDNRASIEDAASQYGIPPQLLAGVVAAELDFDYDWYNHARDEWATGRYVPPYFPYRDQLLPGRANNSQGPANVHAATLVVAIDYLEEHQLPGWEDAQDYPVDNDQYRSSFDGSVEGAAIVTAMYDHQFGGAETPEEQATVWAAYRGGVRDFADREGQTSGGSYASTEDYQAGVGNAAPVEFVGGTNATLSEPIFEFLDEQYTTGDHPTTPTAEPEGPPSGTTTTTTTPPPGSPAGSTTTVPPSPSPGTTTTTPPTTVPSSPGPSPTRG